MAYGLITSLHSMTGQKIVAQHEYNYRLLDEGMSKLEKIFIYHQKEEIYAHSAKQIKYLNDSVEDYLTYLNGRFSNMILGHNGDGINEVKTRVLIIQVMVIRHCKIVCIMIIQH